MTTNLQIIEDSLRDIGVISEIESASAEQGEFSLRRLNLVMEAWKEDDVDIGWFSQTSTADTVPIPDWAELAVVSALAVAIAPKFGASVSPELAFIVDTSVNALKRKVLSEKLTGASMSHLPVGAGKFYRSRRNILTDS